ncbi:MAG: lamin tail domain-containing protein [Bacteroidales bacterium]|nr:lamin tail domain-containing protein [Bacteroidales bacterium]
MKKIFVVATILCCAFSVSSQILEQFTNSGIGNSYSSGQFLGVGDIVWNYMKARGNQQTTTNGDKAISLNKAADACLFSDTIPSGIKFLQFQYEQELTANCDANVYINDSLVGVLVTENEADVTKIFSFSTHDFNENAVIRIQQNTASSGQITIDDIYIEFAQTPFLYNKISIDDLLISAEFSHNILEADVCGDAVENFYFSENKILVSLKNNLCGEYKISFRNVVDTAYKQISDTVLCLAFYDVPQKNKIVISEIMANPSSLIGLDYEYIEVFNSGECSVQCNELQLIIGNNKCQLPSRILNANEYVCITSEKEKASILDSSRFLFVKSFPSIPNTGSTVALAYNDEIISSVSYVDTWYHDSFKQNWGWSLEKIDLENVSETEDNWRASDNKRGGTPGFENSVFQSNEDYISPEIVSIQIVSDSVIDIRFSENIDILHFLDNSEFSFSVKNVEPINNSMSQYRIMTDILFESQTEYNCNISDRCIDYNGNQFVDNQYIFAKTDSLLISNSVLINEILFNPTSGNSDFIELYNNSESYYDLSQMYVSNGSTNYRISDKYILFPPKSFAVISSDAGLYRTESKCKKGIFINSKLPTLPDKEGLVILRNLWGEVIDSVSYSEDWHSAYIVSKEGVSLERVDFMQSSNKSTSWFSAAESVGFSSPGCPNSQAIRNNTKQFFSFDSEVITPNGDGENDELVIFCGDVEVGTMCSVRIFQPSGKMIAQIANNQLLGSDDILRWDCTDAKGNAVNPGIYLVQLELVRNGRKISSEKKSCTVLRE